MHDTALIRDHSVATHKDIVRNCLSENLHFQDVCNDLFGFPVYIWVNKRDVIVACDDVSERGQSLFYALYRDSIGKRIAEMLKLLVGGGGGHEQAMAIA